MTEVPQLAQCHTLACAPSQQVMLNFSAAGTSARYLSCLPCSSSQSSTSPDLTAAPPNLQCPVTERLCSPPQAPNAIYREAPRTADPSEEQFKRIVINKLSEARRRRVIQSHSESLPRAELCGNLKIVLSSKGSRQTWPCKDTAGQ